jgi:hypothetical protein
VPTFIFLLFQVPSSIYLGPTGTVLYTIAVLTMAYFTWSQNRSEKKTRESLNTWKETAQAAVVEKDLSKETCARLREEKVQADSARVLLAEQVSKLQAATDLKPLIEVTAQLQKIMTSWVEEGRLRFSKAENRLDEIHSENTAAMKVLFEELRAQRTTSEDSYRSLTNSFVAHTQEDRESNIENKQIQFRFLNMMDDVERRLSSIAVKVGVEKWEPRQQPVNPSESEVSRQASGSKRR